MVYYSSAFCNQPYYRVHVQYINDFRDVVRSLGKFSADEVEIFAVVNTVNEELGNPSQNDISNTSNLIFLVKFTNYLSIECYQTI